MSGKDKGFRRADTDASLHAERDKADVEFAKRVLVAEVDAERVLRVARERADRVLEAARTAADARLPLSEQTQAAAALLLEQRDQEDRSLATERQRADQVLERERRDQRDRLAALLELERQTTDLHLAFERKTADKALASRDEFLAQASHDLRGLMAAHKLYLALLGKELGEGELGRRLAPHIATLMKIDVQMDRMISDLVDVVAIEAGKLAVKPRPHRAGELVSTAVSAFQPLASERGQSLSLTPAPAEVSVLADSARSIQVLGNLLSNAIKFTPPGGKIQVGFEATDDEVVFFVADTGPGVPAEHAEHIFKRFVASPSASAGLGLGLGLFIASRLVEDHGGRLWFDSDRARGTVFRFTLKRAPA